MVLMQRQILEFMEIILLIILICKPTVEQNKTANFICDHPSCKCTQMTAKPVTYILECKTSTDPATLSRNQSINITHLSVECSKNGNLLTLLEILKYDLTSVRSLSLENCKTALYDVIATGDFRGVKNITLIGARGDLSDRNKLNAGLVRLSELKFINIFNSSTTPEFSLCSQSGLVSINMSGNQLSSVDNQYKNCSLITNTLTKIRVLDLSKNQITELGPWIGLCSSLSDLRLSFNRLDEHDLPILTNLTDLTSLDISNNLMTALPNGSFTHNPHLRSLSLSHNSIAVLEKNSFTGLSQLERLDLSHNALALIEDGALAQLRCLKRLNLGFNLLSVLPLSIFDHLESLQYLLLTNNTLVRVPTFKHLRSLLTLDLKNNKIQRLQRNTFSSLALLQGISLSGNSLTSVDFATFDFSESLFIINLSYNNISSVIDSRRVLSNLAKVSYLRLDYNQLEDISLIGKHFRNLKYLFLDNNHIRTIRRSSLPQLLKIINLSDNKISKIYANTFKYMKNLEMVTIQRNYPYLSTLPRSSVQIYYKREAKPRFYIGGNLFICDCDMAYLKAWTLARNRIPALKMYHPNFSDMQDVYCVTLYDKDATSFRDVPMSHFLCEYKQGRFCTYSCQCCLTTNCTCDNTCPVNCSCYQGGSLWTDDVYDIINCDNKSFTEIPQDIPLTATHLYLGGNEMQFLQSGKLSLLSKVQYLHLNNSGIIYIDPGTFSGMDKLKTLFLDHNSIFKLLNESFNGLYQLEELYLQNNKISYIEENTFIMLINLRFLSLENNFLTTLSADVFGSLDRAPTITLLGNPWSCKCHSMAIFKQFLKQYGSFVKRSSELKCHWWTDNTSDESNRLQKYSANLNLNISQNSPIPILQYDYDSICSVNNTVVNFTVQNIVFVDDGKYITTLVILITIIAISLTISVLVYWKRKEFQAWIFVRFGLRIVNKNKNINEVGRKYDAFVSYSSKDEHVVVHELAPRLEEGNKPYRLCLHYRDFPVGECIADTIIESIEASKRTLMLISENFLSSEWCRYEFQTAHHHILKENTHRLIMVLLEDIDLNDVDPDLRIHLKIGSFLRYNDPWFWEKLYFAMPDRQADLVNPNQLNVDGIGHGDINIGSDDDDDVFYAEEQIDEHYV